MFVCCVHAPANGASFMQSNGWCLCDVLVPLPVAWPSHIDQRLMLVVCWCACQWRDLHTEQWLMFVYGMLMCLPAAWPSHRGCAQSCSGWSCRQTSGQTSSRSTSMNRTTLAISLARTRPWWDCGPRVRLWAQEGNQWLGGYAGILINCTLTILSGGNWAN